MKIQATIRRFLESAKSKLSSLKKFLQSITLKGFMEIFLTLVIIIQSWLIYNLNKNTEMRAVEVYKGRQALLQDKTKDFLVNYINHFISYLAYENNKIVSIRYNNIHGKTSREAPAVSRRFYVNSTKQMRCLESWHFIGSLPDTQNSIDDYFIKKPNLADLESMPIFEGGLLTPAQVITYNELIKLIDIFNEQFNWFAPLNKDFEEELVRELALTNDRREIDWSQKLLPEKNKLVQLMDNIRARGETFLSSFDEPNLEITFIKEVGSSEPFRNFNDLKNNEEPFGYYICPNQESTIELTSKTYTFDYYKYSL